MVGDDVEEEAHVALLKAGGQGGEIILRAECRVEAPGIDDVVAVRAAGAGSEDRRSVEVAYAQLLQIVKESTNVAESEFRVELNTIRGAGDHVRKVARHGQMIAGSGRLRCYGPTLYYDEGKETCHD